MVDAITGGTEGAQAMQQAMQEAQHVTAELREKVEHIADGIAAMQSMPPEQKGAMLADLTFDYYTGAAAAKAGGIAAKLAKRAVGLGAAAKEAGVAGTLAREAETAAAQTAAHAARETEAATAGCVGPQKPKMPGKGTFAAEAPAAAEVTVAAEAPMAAPKAGGIGEPGLQRSKYWHLGYIDKINDTQVFLGIGAAEKGSTTLGSMLESDAWQTGMAWVGTGAKPIYHPTEGLIGYSSVDKLRAFRIHL